MQTANIPDPGIKWQHIEKRDGYTLYQSGSHIDGDFIQVFVPDRPYTDAGGKRKLITYLHGFALCLPKFYEKHLEILARTGYYVFFPDYQISYYPDTLQQENLKTEPRKRHLYFWYQMAIDTIRKGKKLSSAQLDRQLPDQIEKAERFYSIRDSESGPSAIQCFFMALAIAVIILVIRLVYIFAPEYRKNLVDLISTVGLSLFYSPEDWMRTAIDLTEDSWDKLGQDIPELKEIEFDFYVFGHSLGGLLALSWPAFLNKPPFVPKQILTADPAPSTELGIPRIAIFILQIFRAPFAVKPLTIQTTGEKIDTPVGIMHGASDTIVRPRAWIKGSFWNPKPNFDYIASDRKQIYFSLSKPKDHPPLIAFHNQAVTDTTYFNDALFKKFGGVKKAPNDYNFQYIWPGLNFVVTDEVDADQLLNRFSKKTIHIVDTLPLRPPSFPWLILLAGLGLIGLLYWLWRSGFLFPAM